MTETTEILRLLLQPLDKSRIKYRSAPGEGTVPYIEGYDVIHTANQLFAFRWSFDLLSEPKVMIWEQTLTAWNKQKRERTPVLDPETGAPRTQRVGMVYLTGKVTIELDGKPFTHADVGRLSFIGDTPEALDTALSGAATDCLKRCFRQLGDQFGLSLYDKDATRAGKPGAPAETEASTRSGARTNGKGLADVKREKPGNPPGQNGMTVEQAKQVLCPVGSSQNPQWAGMPLGEVQAQPNGERMLVYLVSEKFNDNNDPARTQARQAAKLLLGQVQSQGV